MRRAQNADTHVLKQHRLSQNMLLSAPVLYWLSHLTCISSLKAKNERKTFIFTQLKISRYNTHFFAIFRGLDLRPTYCSLICVASVTWPLLLRVRVGAVAPAASHCIQTPLNLLVVWSSHSGVLFWWCDDVVCYKLTRVCIKHSVHSLVDFCVWMSGSSDLHLSLIHIWRCRRAT